jgi:hypothetical protein
MVPNVNAEEYNFSSAGDYAGIIGMVNIKTEI